MIASDLETAIDQLQELVEAARVVAPFTGAGISTECGIPDFRSPGGLWTKNRPIPFDEFLASQDMRDEAWRRRFAMEAHFARRAARPRAPRARRASTAPARRRRVITQNIDNLHQSSGIAAEHVIELHGNNTYAACLDCAQAIRDCLGRETIRRRRRTRAGLHRLRRSRSRRRRFRSARRCRRREMRRAEQLTLDCDLFLAIGSSLVVWPAAGFPLLAKRNGARS